MVTTKSLCVLNSYMEAYKIPYILTGTFGLSVHGILPDNYQPDDIDVIILVDKKVDEEKYKSVVETLLRTQSLDGKTDKSYENVITFHANGIKVNAFIGGRIIAENEYIGAFEEYGKYKCILINNASIMVSDVMDILKAKFHLRRIKDYIFAKNLASTILNV